MGSPTLTRAGGDLEQIRTYYRSNDVCRRIAEYCGGQMKDAQSFTALWLGGYGGVDHLRTREGAPVKRALSAWGHLLRDGDDICRSLEDRTGTLLVFDLDYMNHEDPFEPYREPARTFERLEPVLVIVRNILLRFGIRPLTLMTGRGYHLVFKAPSGSPLHAALLRLGACDQRDEFTDRDKWPSAEMAHAGAGRLMQFLAHETKRACAGSTAVPVQLIDMPPVGRGPFICLDLSAYGDPLASRTVRCAFSVNQKARGLAEGTRGGVMAVLPRDDESVEEMLRVRSDFSGAAAWAENHSCVIPEVARADAWLAAYEGSRLAEFHRYFDAEPSDDAPADGPARIARWPDCVLFPLSRPNDPLLAPGWIRTVALTLWARGFHPARIVRLIASRYAEPHGWDGYWERYDRITRARFYVRACCAAVADEIEDWKAFTCQTQRLEGFCVGSGCGFDLGAVGPKSGKGMP